MALPTKYVRQRARARKTITKKGTVITWYKSVDSTDDDTTLPAEFQGNIDPQTFKVPAVFIPQERLSLVTELGVAVTQVASNQLFALIPGDLPFDPEVDDAVLIAGKIQHVETINVVQPDMVPILYDVSFK